MFWEQISMGTVVSHPFAYSFHYCTGHWLQGKTKENELIQL